MRTFIVETRGKFNKDESSLDNSETHYSNVSASIKSLEVQVGQLDGDLKTQIKEKFPRDTKTLGNNARQSP